MGFAKKDERCKRHKKHMMSQGVCPHCLRERLALLLSTSSSSRISLGAVATAMSSYSSSSSCSPDSLSSSPSSSALPLHEYWSTSRKKRFAALGQSKDGRKKRGFWSKLLVVF